MHPYRAIDRGHIFNAAHVNTVFYGADSNLKILSAIFGCAP